MPMGQIRNVHEWMDVNKMHEWMREYNGVLWINWPNLLLLLFRFEATRRSRRWLRRSSSSSIGDYSPLGCLLVCLFFDGKKKASKNNTNFLSSIFCLFVCVKEERKKSGLADRPARGREEERILNRNKKQKSQPTLFLPSFFPSFIHLFIHIHPHFLRENTLRKISSSSSNNKYLLLLLLLLVIIIIVVVVLMCCEKMFHWLFL